MNTKRYFELGELQVSHSWANLQQLVGAIVPEGLQVGALNAKIPRVYIGFNPEYLGVMSQNLVRDSRPKSKLDKDDYFHCGQIVKALLDCWALPLLIGSN